MSNSEFRKLKEEISPAKIGEYRPIMVSKEERKTLSKKEPEELFYFLRAENGSWTLKDMLHTEILARLIRIETMLKRMMKEAGLDKEDKR